MPSHSARPQLDDAAHVGPVRHVVAASRGGTTVLLDPVTEEYFTITGSGGVIWELLEDQPTIRELIESLKKRWPSEELSIAEDVRQFLNDLWNHSLLEVR